MSKAAEAGTAATPQMRLHAAQLVAIARTLTAPEMRNLVGAPSPAQAMAALAGWLARGRGPLYPASGLIKRISGTECGRAIGAGGF
jgi:hypothetical protein